MIEELHLINCQSHPDSLLEFEPGLNVITGDTDSGKSAIIRGLNKIVYNSMPSKELVSHWGGPLKIAVKIDGNTVILKHDKKDSYALNKTTFNAVGSKVPEEVQQLFNMNSINIQNQIDTFFLLNETSGYVASYLNEIANLSQIDSTTKSIKSELNEVKRSIINDKVTLNEKEEAVKSYSFLTELESAIKEAEQLEEKVSAIQIEVYAIQTLLDTIENIDGKLLKNKKLLSLRPIINDALNLTDEINELELKSSKLKSLTNSLQYLESELSKLNKLSHLKPLITKATKLKSRKNDFKAKLDILDALIDKLTSIDKKIKIAKSNRLREHEIYHSALSKLDKCFFCGSKLN